MSDRWPASNESLGFAAGILIITSVAVGLIFLAQGFGASGDLLVGIGAVISLVAAVVIARALT